MPIFSVGEAPGMGALGLATSVIFNLDRIHLFLKTSVCRTEKAPLKAK